MDIDLAILGGTLFIFSLFFPLTFDAAVFVFVDTIYENQSVHRYRRRPSSKSLTRKKPAQTIEDCKKSMRIVKRASAGFSFYYYSKQILLVNDDTATIILTKKTQSFKSIAYNGIWVIRVLLGSNSIGNRYHIWKQNSRKCVQMWYFLVIFPSTLTCNLATKRQINTNRSSTMS